MTQVELLADFVANTTFENLSGFALRDLKVRVLDSVGCAIGALDNDLIRKLKEHVVELGGRELCTLIGGGKTAPDRAAFLNCALIRYLDFNDSYLAKGETCHPSDNIGAVLSAAESVDAAGRDFLAALAVAYQIQCRLSDEAPVRDRGFDHVTLGAYSAAGGAARALGLDRAATAQALSISGTANNALRVTRTGRLSSWKGLAFAYAASGAVQAVFLARHGVTGPLEVFEGSRGFQETVSGRFQLDWAQENLEAVTRTILKRHNAEIHAQSAIECVLEIRRSSSLKAENVERIEIETFDVAYEIIGGAEKGSQGLVQTKEQADHSLRYLVAVALLDGEVTPAQYAPGRIGRSDVQELLQRVAVRAVPEFSAVFPGQMPCRARIHTKSGSILEGEAHSYPGFVDAPLSWSAVEEKFHRLADPCADRVLRDAIVNAIANIDELRVSDLTQLLETVRFPGERRTAA